MMSISLSYLRDKHRGSIAPHIGASANANLSVRGDLNNNNGLLSNICGVAAVGSACYGTYKWSSNGGTWKHFFAGLFTGGIFGCASVALRKDDQEEREKERQHDIELALIKHPTSSNSISEITDVIPEVQSNYLPAKKREETNSSPVEFLVSKEVRKGGYTLIAAPKGQGKSILARQVGHAIATGQPCEAFPDDTSHSPQKVIYLDAELTREDNVSRGYEMVQGMDVYTKEDFNYTNLNDLQKDISRMVEDVGSDCTVILDCITSYKFGMSLANINQMKSFNAVLDTIRSKALLKGHVVSFIAVNHISESSKSSMEGMRGCLEAYQNATTIMFISPNGTNNKKVIRVETNRQAQERKWYADIVDKTDASPVMFSYRGDTDKPEVQEISNKPQWEGKLSLEETSKMKEFYMPGVKGHGFQPTAEKFGLKFPAEAQRELEKLEKYKEELAAYKEGISEAQE